MERESFKSRLGFLLVSAGCAVGIGNVWKFPYVVGQNGGGWFVLLYLLFLAGPAGRAPSRATRPWKRMAKSGISTAGLPFLAAIC